MAAQLRPRAHYLTTERPPHFPQRAAVSCSRLLASVRARGLANQRMIHATEERAGAHQEAPPERHSRRRRTSVFHDASRDRDAGVADVDARSRNELLHLLLRPSTERATESGCHGRPPMWTRWLTDGGSAGG